MKRTVFALVIATVLSGNAFATDWDYESDDYNEDGKQLYIGVEGGFSKSKSNGNSTVGSLKFGYYFDKNIRGEFAITRYGNLHDTTALISNETPYSYPASKLTTRYVNVKTKSTTLMANFYYEVQTGTRLTPYIMAGAGIVNNDISGNKNIGKFTFTKTVYKTQLAWQVGVGTSYAFTQNLFGDIGIRYSDRGSISINDVNVIKPDRKSPSRTVPVVSHNVTLKSVDTTIGIRYMF